MIKRGARAALLVALAAAATDCTIVVSGGPDSSTPTPVPVPVTLDAAPVKPVEAHLLLVMNLQQSSANVADAYGELTGELISELADRGIVVVRWAVAPTYPGPEGLKLLVGQAVTSSTPVPILVDAGDAAIPPPDDTPAPADAGADDALPKPRAPAGDLVTTLQLLAGSGKYDGVGTTSEAAATVHIGESLTTMRLPPELGGLDGAAFFDRPRSLFIVAYMQPLARRCALADSACQVDGRSPADIFTEATADGTAAWLKFGTGGMPVNQIVHVALATKEGEDPAAFRARCGAVDGFPKSLFDVMEPSDNLYFDPLLARLNQANPGTGQSGDLCTLMGELWRHSIQRPAMNQLVNSIAAMAGPAAD